jgi:hypothetical protein
MIGERTIREALKPETRGPVVVRSHVRAKPVNAKRQALHEALRRATEDSYADR